MDLTKLKFYYEHVLSQVYDEGHSEFHQSLTHDVVEKFIDPIGLDKSACIVDVGCGPGYFLDLMSQKGYNNLLGITLSDEDIAICKQKQHQVRKGDISFLPHEDESVDLLFSRHSLEHSPFPYITLIEYNRVLKPNAHMYVEVPAPDGQRDHENNLNHYSILGITMWLSLLKRTGFDVSWYKYQAPFTSKITQETKVDDYYIFVCRRRFPMDVK